jgi:hypothetical protein
MGSSRSPSGRGVIELSTEALRIVLGPHPGDPCGDTLVGEEVSRTCPGALRLADPRVADDQHLIQCFPYGGIRKRVVDRPALSSCFHKSVRSKETKSMRGRRFVHIGGVRQIEYWKLPLGPQGDEKSETAWVTKNLEKGAQCFGLILDSGVPRGTLPLSRKTSRRPA